MKELATYAKQHVPKEHPKVKNKKMIYRFVNLIGFFLKRMLQNFLKNVDEN